MFFKSLGSFFIVFTAVASYGHELNFPLPIGANQEDITLYHFCRLNSTDLAVADPNCVASVKAFRGEELVTQCFDQFLNFELDPQTLAFTRKSGRNETYWHRNYERKDKKSVLHRYDYTELAREYAGIKLGRQFYDVLNRSVNTKPPTQTDLENAFAKGYLIGYLQPDFADVRPDLYCEKGKQTCESSSGDVKNQYPNTNPPAVKPPENAVREDGALFKIKNGQGPADVQDQNPVETCIMKKVTQKLKAEKTLKLAPWGRDTPHPQIKATNGYLLKLGVCDSSYWGTSFCSSYNDKVHNVRSGT
jgi:hypothetical protein